MAKYALGNPKFKTEFNAGRSVTKVRDKTGKVLPYLDEEPEQSHVRWVASIRVTRAGACCSFKVPMFGNKQWTKYFTENVCECSLISEEMRQPS
ncbi:hypothetical protein NDU88_002065 [Pleurodeles waltl]|uniref:Uncharacterized protein n=1 Tax=Pleurodeles waltl TaxID=8319 RepID=A0AAV7TM02_PLEWA|nr:hypothetical protein NDU88_002065 [Pleurodeles waltl]